MTNSTNSHNDSLKDSITRKQQAKRAVFGQYINSSDSVLHVGAVGGATNPDWPKEAWMHAYLEEMSEECVGIDIDSSAVERLQSNGHDIRHADAQDFDLGRTFNTIAAPNVIEHLPNPGQFLDCCADHIEEDGQVIISTPRPWTLHHVLTYLKDREMIVDPTHTCWFDEPTFRRLADLSPLEVSEKVSYSWPRVPAGSLDKIYLIFENALRRAGVDDQLLAPQHAYRLTLASDSGTK